MSPRLDSKHRLDQLPNEALLSIWEHLDDLVPLSRVNKRFQQLSKDTLWRAKWLVQRNAPYLVLFEAIARPKIFTEALLDRLIRLGAPLSCNLVQLLHLMHNPLSTYLTDNEDRFKWGKITLVAYLAVMQHAVNLVSVTMNSLLTHSMRSIWPSYSSQAVLASTPQYGENLELKELRLFDSSIFSGLSICSGPRTLLSNHT